ncbi:MAG: ribosomal protein S18-alanine N-acetyltransferase [Acidobacteria bacterium]|nr:ribosomal protein S18-alanine N-acetyltransferase [Acidobacteriota bacterium]
MQAKYRVRRVRLPDLPRILEIERAGFGKWAWDRNLFAEYTHTCGEHFLVAEEGGKVVGYAIACLERGMASLDSIAVAPEARGKGAAARLLASLVRRLKRRGVARLALMVKVTNRRARAFYERHGFRRVRQVARYYEDGQDGVLYHLDLAVE